MKRRNLDLPHFHSLRHSAAMDCEDAEEARDLLRHKNSNVTRAVYRAHFGDVRRERLRARLEARHGSADGSTMGATDRNGGRPATGADGGKVVELQAIRDTRQ